MLKVLVEYADFNEKMKVATIPFKDGEREGSQKLEIVDKVLYAEDGVTVQGVTDVVKFTYADGLDFKIAQEMNKAELEDYLEVLRRFIVQMDA